MILKIVFTAFISILVPTYWHYYGLQNFLWLSDIGLFLTLLSLWTNSKLLMSMAAVGVSWVELLWCVDFFGNLLMQKNMINLAGYMFNSAYPIWLRAISLFHIITPIIWIWYLTTYGYDKRAFIYMTVLYWIVLPLTYLFTEQSENINWVFIPYLYKVQIPPLVWVVFLLIGFPLLIFLPTHLIYTRLFTT